MISQRIQSPLSPLRLSVIALWIFSLVGAGASPLYYVSTPDSPVASVVGHPAKSNTHETNTDRRNSLSLRFTHNPFTPSTIQSNDLTANTTEGDPLAQDGGMTHNPPGGSPVTLWLVSASANGTVSSSNSTRFHDQSDAADIHTRRPSTITIAATSIHPEHPAKRFAATLLGHKPSGVS